MNVDTILQIIGYLGVLYLNLILIVFIISYVYFKILVVKYSKEELKSFGFFWIMSYILIPIITLIEIYLIRLLMFIENKIQENDVNSNFYLMNYFFLIITSTIILGVIVIPFNWLTDFSSGIVGVGKKYSFKTKMIFLLIYIILIICLYKWVNDGTLNKFISTDPDDYYR